MLRSFDVSKVIENESLRGGLFQPLNQPRNSHGSRTAQERVHVVHSTHGRLQSPGAGWVIFVYFSCFFQVFREFIRFFPGLFAFSGRTTPAHPIQC